MKSSSAVLLSASFAVVLAGGALAAGKQPTKAQRAQVLQAIVDCRKVTEESARLKCYDDAAAKLDEAEASGQVVVVDREQARTVRKEVFGLQLPSLDIFNLAGKGSSAAKNEDVDRISSAVKSAFRQGDGKWVVELDTGAVWRQIEPADVVIDVRQGAKAEVRRGSLGSYFLKVEGQPAFKAHRDR